MKISCSTAHDLIPGYAEDLLSKDSNELIEEHIKDCPECSSLIENLKADAEKTEAEILEASGKEIKPLKKYRRRINIGNIICGLLAAVYILTAAFFLFKGVLEYHYTNLTYYVSHEIFSLVSEDPVTGEKLILPLSYEKGIIAHNGRFHYRTLFLSDETARELSDRINALNMTDCTASVFSDTTVLIRFRDAYFRLERNDDKQYWYDWDLTDLSHNVSGEGRNILFPLHLCKKTAIPNGIEEPVGLYTAAHTFEDFVKFYEESGFYIIEVKENTIILLGYSDSRYNMQEEPFFPMNIVFTEEAGLLTISFTFDDDPDSVYF